MVCSFESYGAFLCTGEINSGRIMPENATEATLSRGFWVHCLHLGRIRNPRCNIDREGDVRTETRKGPYLQYAVRGLQIPSAQRQK